MKKLLATILCAATVVAAACSFSACTTGAKVKIIDIGLSSEQYGVAIKKGDSATKSAVDGVLTKLKGEGVTVNGAKVTFDSLYEAEMTAEDLISIGTVKKASTARENELVVATNAEFAPFEYMVGDSFGGIDMQIAKILASELKKELVILHMDFDMVTEAVSSGKADVALAGLTINEERLEKVDFSIPYYDTTQCIAVAENDTTFDLCKTEEDVVNTLKSLTNAKAGAAKAQTGYYYLVGNESFEFEGYSNINTNLYNSVALAVQDLANGKLSLVCGDKDTITAAVKAVNG